MSLLPYSLKASLASQLTLRIPSLPFKPEITGGPSHPFGILGGLLGLSHLQQRNPAL